MILCVILFGWLFGGLFAVWRFGLGLVFDLVACGFSFGCLLLIVCFVYFVLLCLFIGVIG